MIKGIRRKVEDFKKQIRRGKINEGKRGQRSHEDYVEEEAGDKNRNHSMSPILISHLIITVITLTHTHTHTWACASLELGSVSSPLI